MTEEIQEKFDNILLPTGTNPMVELSNQDLLTFIQNQISQDTSIRYQGSQKDTMQTTNNPTIVTNKNETHFFPPQEPSSTTQERMLQSFDHNHNIHELTIPKEHYLFESQSPFQVTNSNHNRFTKKTNHIIDQARKFLEEGNEIKTVNNHCGMEASSEIPKLYQDHNGDDETDQKAIMNNITTTKQNHKNKYKEKPHGSTPIPKNTSSKRKEDTPVPILFSPDKQKTVNAPPHKRISRNINSSKYAKLRAILEDLEEQEHSPKSPHSQKKKENRTLHHFQIEVVHIMKEDMARMIEKCKPIKSKKSS